MPFPLNELQTKLEYKFENNQLPHEALTHDFNPKSSEWDIFDDGNVFYPKRKLHRLRCVGVSVLKLLMAEKAVIIHAEIKDNKRNNFSDEGFLTLMCNIFHEKCDFNVVGSNLKLWRHSHSTDNAQLIKPSVIKEMIQAIFGAVFIDGGGCESKNDYAMQSVRKLYDLLVIKYDLYCFILPDSQKIYDCFFGNHPIIREYLIWKNYAEEIEPYKSLEERLGYKFNNPGLAQTALTHDSVKGLISSVSHYEVLEFLGDAVYELVICEYLFWHFINDRDGNVFNFGLLTNYVSKKFQQVLAKGLNLERYIIKPDHVKVNDIHDFLESIVGAIYIDAKSLRPVKMVLVELCRIFELETVGNCDIRLPYALRTYYGSSYHVPSGKLGMIKEDHRLPPKRQDIFRIVNFYKLGYLLQQLSLPRNFCGSIHSYDNNAKVVGSESWCNQQEFVRVSLYQTFYRIQHFYVKGLVLPKYHTYDPFDKIFPQVPPACALVSVPSIAVTENKGKCQDMSSKPTFSNVWDALRIIFLWICNWVVLFVRQLGKLSLFTGQIMAIVGIAVLVLEQVNLVFKE